MADGDYERREGRTAELARLKRLMTAWRTAQAPRPDAGNMIQYHQTPPQEPRHEKNESKELRHGLESLGEN